MSAFIYATPAEYTRRTGNSITQYGESPMLAELARQGLGLRPPR